MFGFVSVFRALSHRRLLVIFRLTNTCWSSLSSLFLLACSQLLSRWSLALLHAQPLCRSFNNPSSGGSPTLSYSQISNLFKPLDRVKWLFTGRRQKILLCWCTPCPHTTVMDSLPQAGQTHFVSYLCHHSFNHSDLFQGFLRMQCLSSMGRPLQHACADCRLHTVCLLTSWMSECQPCCAYLLRRNHLKCLKHWLFSSFMAVN